MASSFETLHEWQHRMSERVYSLLRVLTPANEHGDADSHDVQLPPLLPHHPSPLLQPLHPPPVHAELSEEDDEQKQQHDGDIYRRKERRGIERGNFRHHLSMICYLHSDVAQVGDHLQILLRVAVQRLVYAMGVRCDCGPEHEGPFASPASSHVHVLPFSHLRRSFSLPHEAKPVVAVTEEDE
ncbi:hypothetical protein B296_00033526 [Ensete ventricosum]|uniref:Uncharacterized protein n=1 Tax=Ensete ventricosum TaxID=4639 RepID=A0A427AAK9_ENSVE|nr:hypothetical protein B296_00033526 [Ensete ventricosum]